MNCTPNCTWTRTVRNTLTSATSWTATGNGDHAGIHDRRPAVELQLYWGSRRDAGTDHNRDAEYKPDFGGSLRRSAAALSMPLDRMALPSPMSASRWQSKVPLAAPHQRRLQLQLQVEAVPRRLRSPRVRTSQRATQWRVPVTTVLLLPRTTTGAPLT